MAKRRRVPEVLWRLFRDRARRLADTIIYLIPPSTAAECRCKGRRCIGCCGEDAMSFLLRPDDPSDYRKLLTQCFVVVSATAPSLQVLSPHQRWSQREIVRRTIEAIMVEQPKSTNVLCSSYDMRNHSSPIVELLTCSAWCLLLERVGDSFMVYILKHTSIFLPLPRKKLHQVAGPPISDLCPKFSKHMPESEYQDSSLLQLGPRKKRKRVEGVDSVLERQQVSNSFSCAGPSNFVSCIGCRASDIRPFSRHCMKKHSQVNLFEAVMHTTGVGSAFSKGNPNVELQQSSNQITAKPRKRVRQFSWQRHRKRRQLNFQEIDFLTPCTRIPTDKRSITGGLQCCSNTNSSHHHDKMPRQCPCCVVLQAPLKVTKGAQINRQYIFYNSECSSSIFPTNHVLNSLKPNLSCANFLFRDIFGLSDANTSPKSMSCFHRNDFCLIGSACLYHSLVKMLKLLIRRARCCQHLRLLDKHCSVPSFNQNDKGNACSMFEDNKSKTNSLKKGDFGVKLEGNPTVEKSHGFDAHCKKTPETVDDWLQPNKSYCLKSQVVSFVWAVCRSIVPPDMLGTGSNWRILRRNISKFIHLRRFEKFSLRQCMHKLKTSRFPFLSNKHSSCYLSNPMLKFAKGQRAYMHKECTELNDVLYVKHKVLEVWIFWFFSCLVVPLVQANFYVTESEHGKQDVFYYRKSTWEKLTSSAITCLKDQSFHYLDAASIRKIISNRSFGFSRLRLCPKDNGVRVLANLKASSRMPSQESCLKDKSCIMNRKARLHPKRVKFDYFKPVNCVLRDLHAVLKGLQMREPEKLGSSVFDYNDVYRRLCPFLISMKNGSTIMPHVYIVVSDVVKAFDSVDQDKLLSVMKNVVLQDEYLLKQFHLVGCTKKSLWVHEKLMLTEHSIGNDLTEITSSVLFRSLHSVLVSQGRNRDLRKEDLYSNLIEHIKRNVLQLDKKFYLQRVGIPQGSVLSSLLCSFYYGHLERNVIFPFLEKAYESTSEDLSRRHNCCDSSAAQKRADDDMILSSPKYMLLRFIDDFLFISTSKKQAASFFSRMQRGFREYNCYMNKEKFCLNFDIDHICGLPSNRVYVGEDGKSFLRWSGLLINCCSLEVQADYTRYLKNHLSSTLTVCWEGKPGRHLKEKLCDFMRPKCHPIFYDSNINSAAIVRLNIYQAFLLCAMKFHCYVRDLSYICKLPVGSYLDIIEKSFRYMNALIKKRMHSMYLGSDFNPVLQLEKGEVEWLGLNAYINVLKRKQARHNGLLSLLRSKLVERKRLQNVSSQLKYAVDDSHSSLLWKIKY